jgi:hypothetical protein
MPIITTDVDFEVWCSCGKGLCNQVTVTTKQGHTAVIVEPCQHCLEAAYDEGYDQGKATTKEG